MIYILFFVVCFGASIIGALCGIGGGVIIKPVLDATGVLPVAAVGFLSCCTVLAMTCYSVVRAKVSKSTAVEGRTATPLALGAAIGGLLGKSMFSWVAGLFENQDTVGAVQAAVLAVLTAGTLIYTVKKNSFHTKRLENLLVCLAVGLILGILSSFLGIGGGPFNLVVFYYFFSMDTKVAAQNSLYVVLFSQAANLLMTLCTGGVPAVSPLLVLGMVAAGICGGMAGRVINKRISTKAVERLFEALMVAIILINIYNIVKYL